MRFSVTHENANDICTHASTHFDCETLLEEITLRSFLQTGGVLAPTP